ncbi:Elongation factor 1-gamma Short=EF-1-gamma; AltName: Full=eEF-1B gamma [Serendipita indica DSM 11827]|uniref:Related to translation elongation factor eEF1, gamma chain n=1 Tax=Serendipita indica (strain DSM 11827) TaxID=1109443 RepID=G4TLP7_SERID|nr:Elongation factor 1-gamma Short=EF-1-gamma; AltName: Full=eEF-1B gamma [Serendipita indica DSM 11827]CCA72243.1 related to translation elongation factor eEF1, gamma chain [Serendipita indica DSM 11827]
MASIGTLWTTPIQTSGKRIKAAAALGGLKLDKPASYKHYEDNKKPEFLSKFASGKVPAFEGADGFTLFEGGAIARYVASLAPNSGLLGNTPQERALVEQWISYLETEIAAPVRFSVRMLGGAWPYNKPADQLHRDLLPRPLKVLDEHLATRTYLVGERITLADLTVGMVMVVAYEQIIDKKTRDQYPNLHRLYETIREHPQLKAIWGPTEYIDAPKQYTPPAKAPKEPKEPKAPKAAAPKAEKAPKKEAEEEDDDDNGVPPEPKAKHPLDELPKSTFNLEDWKRAYSNMETKGPGGSIEWFNERFDPEGFSVWRVDFKYNEELTQTFMSSNQISGFFNRLEGARKYLFGSMGVLGENNNSIITGVLICRGKDYKPVVEFAPDWESYSFQPLDYKGADKDFFESALAWDLEIDGKKWAAGKNFK